MAEDNVKAQMRKGILEYCILAILSREDSYAPKIIAELKQAEMIVVEGTLYPILTRQKNAGLLTYRWEESPQGPPRKYYTLTDKGREYLATLDEAWDELVGQIVRSQVGLGEQAPLLGKNIKGSGKIVAKTVPAPDFDGIEASRAVKVVISDKVSDIRIEADDNLIDLVVVRAVKGKLEATLDQKVNNIQNGNVTITVPANGKIRSLDASSASKIIGETTLKAGKFSIEASSAAKIKAAVEAVSCTIETSSASKVEMSSASKLNAEKFSAVNATIDTSSAASASIDCSGKLTASASSGSSVRYSGDCRTSLEKSSGGSIRKL